MFFNKFATLALFPLLAVAVPWGATPTKTITVTAAAPTVTEVSQCNTGNLQCCNSVQEASSSEASKSISALGLGLQGLTGQVGFTCTPISALGIGSSSCTAQTVCCENNSFKGLIALGCSPVNVNL